MKTEIKIEANARNQKLNNESKTKTDIKSKNRNQC